MYLERDSACVNLEGSISKCIASGMSLYKSVELMCVERCGVSSIILSLPTVCCCEG